MSEVLHMLETTVQEIALAFMGTVYLLRLLWMFHFKAGKELTYGAGNPRAGVAYSMMNVAMPWAMESVRKDWSFYAQFVIFHVGVIAAISATFIIPYWPELFQIQWVVWIFQLSLGAAAGIGIIRLIRRITSPVMRLISTPDDYFSLDSAHCFFCCRNFCRAQQIPDKRMAAYHLLCAHHVFLNLCPLLKDIPLSLLSVYTIFSRKNNGASQCVPTKKW